MSRKQRIATSTAIPLTIAAAAGAAWVAVDVAKADDSPDSRANERARPAASVQVVEGLEVAPSATVSDWAKIADYVVTASVKSERAIEQAKGETSSDSETLVFREVTAKIDSEIWKAPSAAKHDLASEITLRAMGWARTEGGGRQELAPGDGSRLEVGHSYLVALAWVPATCGEDGDVPAHWATIGSGGALPADGGIVGAGEYEGEPSQSARTKVPDSVLANLSGKKTSEAAPLFEAVPPAVVGTSKTGPFAESKTAGDCDPAN